MLITLALAFVAGVLSILSPCVLPLLPIVLGAAAGRHRYGPAALSLGVALSFVAVGLFVATVGFSIGLDGATFRLAAALLMLVVGLVLVLPSWQGRVAVAAGPVGAWADRQLAGRDDQGLTGQFVVGLLLGMAWSPCVGPTLGAASVLAAEGRSLGAVTLTMVSFGIGAALPLGLVGSLSRQALVRWRGRMIAGGARAKRWLGALILVLAVSILTGLDRVIETALVAASPEWLTRLTTTF